MKALSMIFSEENGEKRKIPFEIQKRTIVLRPSDILLLMLLLLLHTLCGVTHFFGTVLLSVPTAALYAAYCCRSRRFSLLLPVVGFVTALLVTANGYRAAGALFVGLLAFCLFDAVSSEDKRRAKTSAVARCTLALWGYVGFLCLIFRLFHPEFSFTAAIDSAFDGAEAQALSQLKTLYDMPELSELLQSGMYGKTVSFETLSEAVHNAVLQTKYTSPAVVTVIFSVLSYLTASLFKGFCRLLREDRVFGGVPFEIALSSVSLFCYFIVSLGMLFARGDVYFYCRNLAFVLSPGFMLCGIKQIGVFFEKFRLPRVALGFIKAGCVAAALLLGNLGSTVLILLGMLYTLNGSVRHVGRRDGL